MHPAQRGHNFRPGQDYGMNLSFQGKTALILGGSSAIGLALTLQGAAQVVPVIQVI